MDGANGIDVERVVGSMMWTDMEVDDNGKVSVNEFGRYLRQHGVDVSNFAILRIVSDGQTPQTNMDHEMFVNAKEKLVLEHSNQTELTPEEKLRKYKANYLDLWREHSRSRNETGEIPVSQLPHIVFAECNPTRELLDALIAVKQDGSESINFEEFCEMLENLPQSGMIDENRLLKAFQTEDIDGSGYISRSQLYSLLIENGNDPLKKEEVDEMMEDCGSGDRFKYTDWVQRVITIKSLSEK
ncbi:troponin C, skeletal muscle-like [Mercenaria mercenaria]|uniref:troponin C, skeletal muscle-like n=1 Tax=Mercenaria mercenaria TaxID=6596 RepID=UPI00234E6189|nr:troponin C, skeletal muscle-like [Mercenaria mercenaria]